jgi:hypothetical protein
MGDGSRAFQFINTTVLFDHPVIKDFEQYLFISTYEFLHGLICL